MSAARGIVNALLLELALVAAILGVLAIAGCGLQDVGGGAGLDLPWFGVVEQCTVDTGSCVDGGCDPFVTVEYCYDGDGPSQLAKEIVDYGVGVSATCENTPRHAGPCIYGCLPHAGCNAHSGCWCPRGPE